MTASFTPRASAIEDTDPDMPLFTVEEVIEVTSARLLAGDGLRLRDKIRQLSTDSRAIGPGDLFVAIKGERFDGHGFVEAALRQEAVGAIVESTYRVPASLRKADPGGERRRSHHRSCFLLGVQDPLAAFQQLAAHHRTRFTIPVVAVTGSNGKTTTKEMVAQVLAERWNVLKTEGNLNNRIGVPQTLLRLTSRHKAAVIEMGVDQKGQTTRLTEIVRPTIGLITNIGPDHLEFFGTLEASAQAKGELLDAMHSDDAVVLNADDAFFDCLGSRASGRIVSFGLSPRAHVRSVGVVADQRRGITFRFLLPGKARSTSVALRAHGAHNVSNALAAAAVGHLCNMSGADIARGLSRFRPATMRSQVEIHQGIKIINDCYNANPASMHAAIDLLAGLGAGVRTIAVLGDMLELGSDSPMMHREVGAYLAAKEISFLIACGALGREFAEGARAAGMTGERIRLAADAAAASRLLPSMVRHTDVVLVKASRGMRMEQIVDVLRGRAGRRASGAPMRSVGKGQGR